MVRICLLVALTSLCLPVWVAGAGIDFNALTVGQSYSQVGFVSFSPAVTILDPDPGFKLPGNRAEATSFPFFIDVPFQPGTDGIDFWGTYYDTDGDFKVTYLPDGSSFILPKPITFLSPMLFPYPGKLMFESKGGTWFQFTDVGIGFEPLPEPATWILLPAGLALIFAVRRRRAA